MPVKGKKVSMISKRNYLSKLKVSFNVSSLGKMKLNIKKCIDEKLGE